MAKKQTTLSPVDELLDLIARLAARRHLRSAAENATTPTAKRPPQKRRSHRRRKSIQKTAMDCESATLRE